MGMMMMMRRRRIVGGELMGRMGGDRMRVGRV